jgi:hypothetical protein
MIIIELFNSENNGFGAEGYIGNITTSRLQTEMTTRSDDIWATNVGNKIVALSRNFGVRGELYGSSLE